MKQSLIGIVVSLLAVLLPSAALAQETSPLTVDGEAVTRIVRSHVAEPSLLVAGERGLYARADGEWVLQSPNPPAGDIVWAGGRSGLMLAGDHAPCMRGGGPFDLNRSTDGGATWSVVAGHQDLRPLMIWPESEVALAASCSGLQISSDGGMAWDPVPGIEAGYEITAFGEVASTDVNDQVVLLGLTGEGGTSQIFSVDVTDPKGPKVEGPLRDYYGLGGLTGMGDTYVLAAIDGVWISGDAGATWERSADGLGDVVLERDPLVDGLPQDMSPNAYGLEAVAFHGDETPGLIVGSVNGVYVSPEVGGAWTLLDGTSGHVSDVQAAEGTVLYATDEGVFEHTGALPSASDVSASPTVN